MMLHNPLNLGKSAKNRQMLTALAEEMTILALLKDVNCNIGPSDILIPNSSLRS